MRRWNVVRNDGQTQVFAAEGVRQQAAEDNMVIVMMLVMHFSPYIV
jgi:hypothetical protein